MAESLFDRQYKLLEKELDLIDTAIRQLDDITKGIKNWAIVTWTASVGIGLATQPIRQYIWLTVVLPPLFWLVDASYRRVQRTFIARNEEIRDFVNSSAFREAATQGSPFSFELLRLRSKKGGWKNRMLGVMLFRTVGLLYVGLSALSILVWWVVK